MSRSLTSTRTLLLILLSAAALLVLAACGRTESTTALQADGSGTHTIEVQVRTSDLGGITGSEDTVEQTIRDALPSGMEYRGRSEDGGTSIFTFEVAFSTPEEYAGAAQAALDAGGVEQEATVGFTPPTEPFTSGYALTRSFDDVQLMRWLPVALIDSGAVIDSSATPESMLETGAQTVTVDGAALPAQGEGTWSTSATRTFTSVTVTTTGFEDPAAGQFQRTITYELPSEDYLAARTEFDAFFAAATPDGGALTAPSDSDTTWTIAFPAGSAEQVAAWTDTALAAHGSAFAAHISTPEDADPFTQQLALTDTPRCTVACGDSGNLAVRWDVPTTWTDEGGGDDADSTQPTVTIEADPYATDPRTFTRTIPLEGVSVTLRLNRDGGGQAQLALHLSEENEQRIGADRIREWLAGADAESVTRSAADSSVTLTRTVEGADSAALTDALLDAGFAPLDDGAPIVVEGDDSARVDFRLRLRAPEVVAAKAPDTITWMVQGDRMTPLELVDAGGRDAQLADVGGVQTIVYTSGENQSLELQFLGEAEGLSTHQLRLLIVGLALLGVLVTAVTLAIMYRRQVVAFLRRIG